MSPMMEFSELQMPFICLLVSGGHSMIVDVKEKGEYEILGQSQDDAVGEAFDKVAKMLDLPYPDKEDQASLQLYQRPLLLHHPVTVQVFHIHLFLLHLQSCYVRQKPINK